jgi:beta-mannosidase
MIIENMNDNWEFSWHWCRSEVRGPLMADELMGKKWYPATVPGNVQADLEKLGLVDDPFFADNADHLRWCEEVDFWYRRSLKPVTLVDGQRAILHFDGLDCFATIWIDGRQVGQHENMFIPYWIDVTEHLRADRSVELLIRLASNFQAVETSHRDPCDHPPMARVRSRKAQISYGWDIGPRIVTNGLWRPVRLEVVEKGRILYAGARTVSLEKNRAAMEFVATVDWHDRPATVTIDTQVGPTKISKSIELVGGENDIVIPFEIANPELWWPRGHGKASLYSLDMKLVDATHKALDRKDARVGVCLIEMLQEPRKDGGRGLRFKINGRDYFAKGLNWTPSDSMFGRVTDERIRKLVKLSAEANVNMLRVWGGGVYEPESFLQACDEAGILIWQDFMMACTHYPQDPEFLAGLKTEIEKVVRAYRGHVSMGAWSGDNEVDCGCGVEYGTVITRCTIPEVLKALDPLRPYLPTSPFSDPGKHPNDPIYGDCHLWNHTIRHDDPFYTGFHANFVSEIGRISLPSRKTIDRFIPKDQQWPTDNRYWHYHASDVNNWWIYRHLGHVLEGVRNNGYAEPKSLSEMIEVTQKIQSDACRFWIEHFGGDEQCWGILLWNLCDCWPQVSDAVISYDLELKQAYHAVKEAFGKLKR